MMEKQLEDMDQVSYIGTILIYRELVRISVSFLRLS